MRREANKKRMRSREEWQQMFNDCEKENFEGKEKKEGGNFFMKTLTPKTAVVDIGNLIA